jgi:hypothetical protein
VKKLFTIFFGVLIFFSYSNTLKAQNDCCGLGSIFQSMVQSGLFGGYGMQQFSAKGLNEVIPQDVGFKDFGTAWGWRAGANILGFRQNDMLVAFKFYYQSMTEKQERTGDTNGDPFTQELKLNLNQFDLGMSFSYILNSSFDFRVIDVYISWTSAKLTNSFTSANPPADDIYKSTSSDIGFTFDTGIVWYPFPPYLSLGILGGYSIFTVDKLRLEEGSSSLTEINDTVDGGGFFAMAVLTIGIPFN